MTSECREISKSELRAELEPIVQAPILLTVLLPCPLLGEVKIRTKSTVPESAPKGSSHSIQVVLFLFMFWHLGYKRIWLGLFGMGDESRLFLSTSIVPFLRTSGPLLPVLLSFVCENLA